jgi:hypothetical protein
MNDIEKSNKYFDDFSVTDGSTHGIC